MTLSDTKGSLICGAWPVCPDIVWGQSAAKESCRTYSTSSTAITLPIAPQLAETAYDGSPPPAITRLAYQLRRPGLGSQHAMTAHRNTHFYEGKAPANAGPAS